jgi:hypothetical protein
MAAVTTERLLAIALELAGWDYSAECGVAAPGTRIGHVLLGVEAGAAELFMARQLGYHAVVAHDPTGTAAALEKDWQRERERLTANGVPQDNADPLVGAAAARHAFQALSANYDHATSIARLLDMPYVIVGAALDEVARSTVQGIVDDVAARQPDATLANLRDALRAVPEYAAARTVMTLALGEWSAPAGRTLVVGDATAPISGDLVHAYLSHGVRTLCCPTVGLADAARLPEAGVRGNVLVLGRIATASIGLNAYAARLRSEGLEVTPFAGVAAP